MPREKRQPSIHFYNWDSGAKSQNQLTPKPTLPSPVPYRFLETALETGYRLSILKDDLSSQDQESVSGGTAGDGSGGISALLVKLLALMKAFPVPRNIWLSAL
jgi:hypothetical protein